MPDKISKYEFAIHGLRTVKALMSRLSNRPCRRTRKYRRLYSWRKQKYKAMNHSMINKFVISQFKACLA